MLCELVHWSRGSSGNGVEGRRRKGIQMFLDKSALQ